MSVIGAMFAPLESVSPDAKQINDQLAKRIEENLKAGEYPEGLRKQFVIQLERIKAQLPSCEIMMFPGLSSFGCKKSSFSREPEDP